MAVTLKYAVDLAPDRAAFESIKTELASLANYFVDAWDSVSDIIWDDFTAQSELAYKDVSASFEKLGGSIKDTTIDALGGSVVSVFRGEIDQIDTLWENAWNSMSNTAEGIISGLFDKLAGHAIDFAGNLGMDFLVNPVVDWLGSAVRRSISPPIAPASSFWGAQSA